MNRKHNLGYMQNIESFTARGEIQFKKINLVMILKTVLQVLDLKLVKI